MRHHCRLAAGSSCDQLQGAQLLSKRYHKEWELLLNPPYCHLQEDKCSVESSHPGCTLCKGLPCSMAIDTVGFQTSFCQHNPHAPPQINNSMCICTMNCKPFTSWAMCSNYSSSTTTTSAAAEGGACAP